MKTIKFLFAILVFAAVFNSCTNEGDDPIIIAEEHPLEKYNMLTAMKANGHEIEVYSEQNQFTIGYNELFFRIRDEAVDTYVSDATIAMNPIMHMTEMMHSCPKSAISKTDNASVYKGFAIFQMPSNTDEYWDLDLNYTIEGQSYKAKERIEVKAPADGKRRVNTFMGTDDIRYIIAMVPMTPEVKVNDFSAMVFKMENMMTFRAVEGYTISIDPRMPSMGNHSSPNNESLNFDATIGMYSGKLSLTMTGYWKINLKLMNVANDVLKGEEVTEENEASSLFFEIEF